MIIVSDTTPINYLILIGAIDILEKLFGQVIIPDAVLADLLQALLTQDTQRKLQRQSGS